MKTCVNRSAAVFLVALLFAPLAEADLYAANAAYGSGDFPRAFELFRELAELGQPLAQETIAVMYVQGQGVPRNNVLGYAWAQIATENGMGANVRPIIEQLEPRLTPAARKTVDEVRGKFGKAALEQTLLPRINSAYTPPQDPERPVCKMSRPANPDDFYPKEAIEKAIPGSVVVKTVVLPDGRARNPRVLLSVPPNAFDWAGRMVALRTVFDPSKVDGVAVPCSITFTVRFTIKPRGNLDALTREVDRLKRDSATGDPMAQLQYGVLLTGFSELNKEHENFAPMFLSSAQAGVHSAQYIIGMYTLAGTGVVGDRKKGIVWLTLAAEAGQQDAQIALANELLRDSPDAEQVSRARTMLERAVAGGSQEARYYLADVLMGDVDPARRDPKRALEMLGEVFGLKDEDPATFEIRAAALSQLGDCEAAARAEKSAITRARRLGWDEAPLAERLAMYQKKQAWSQRLLVY